MLDYDGTLSPFTPDRDNAQPYDGVISIVDEIAKSDRTRVVIISGRSIKTLKQLIGINLSCELWGSHGAEKLISCEAIEMRNMDRDVLRGLAAIDGWVEESGLEAILERKPVGRAFHWRGESDKRILLIKDMVINRWRPEVDKYGLEIHEFNCGIELRPKGISKADAVKSILDEFTCHLPAAYLGDDLTDEDAFVALGDRGLKVLISPELRPTSADIRIDPPGELLVFLKDWLNAIT